jgi:tyrosinase
MRKSNRRSFLAESGKAAAATVLGSALFGADGVFAAPIKVRRNVAGLGVNDPILVSYRKAIKEMRKLPDHDPVSWKYQAAVHWTTLSPVLPFWDKCEHGTNFFWSWHRMYLYWFERIVQEMSHDKDWAIPYWNWAPGSDFKLPAPFRVVGSELYTVNRDPNINNGTGSLNPAAVSVTSSFAVTSFYSTNLNVQAPHGAVHTETGGTPAGWMYLVSTAAQDPIFYLHHSNVDRLWDLWLAQGGGRSDPVTEAAWTGKTYQFHDEHRRVVKMTACDILRAAQQLRYEYEDEPPQVLDHCNRHKGGPKHFRFERETLFQLPGPPVELKAEHVTVPIELRQIRERMEKVAASPTDMLLLHLEGMEADEQPGVVWGVWVGLPAGTEPVAEIPSHVGVVALFGAGIRSETAGHEFMPAETVLPLNRAVLEALKTQKESLEVRFVPLGILVDGKATTPRVRATPRIGKVTLEIEHATAID